MKLVASKQAAEVQLGDATITVVGLSDPGRGRKGGVNEDAWTLLTPNWLRRRPLVLVVADGMGGHLGGKKASQIIVRTFHKSYRACSYDVNPERFLEGAVRKAHKRIRQEGSSNQYSRGMGSTVVASLITDNRVSLVNVGDSRGYLIRAGTVIRLTLDHSWVEGQIRSGAMTEREARKHPKRNQLTMSINSRRTESEIKPSFAHFKPECGDVLLLCTDGLWGVLSEDEIFAIVNELSLEGAVRKLINLANISQGKDNITVVLSKWECSEEVKD